MLKYFLLLKFTILFCSNPTAAQFWMDEHQDILSALTKKDSLFDIGYEHFRLLSEEDVKRLKDDDESIFNFSNDSNKGGNTRTIRSYEYECYHILRKNHYVTVGKACIILKDSTACYYQTLFSNYLVCFNSQLQPFFLGELYSENDSLDHDLRPSTFGYQYPYLGGYFFKTVTMWQDPDTGEDIDFGYLKDGAGIVKTQYEFLGMNYISESTLGKWIGPWFKIFVPV